MRASLAILALMAAGLSVSALALRLGDRQALTPPPDAVLESFARQIGERRYDMATRYLSAGLARRVDAPALRERFEPLQHALGDVNTVDAEVEWMNRSHASARATIDGERGAVTMRAPLVWEHGGWALEALPDKN